MEKDKKFDIQNIVAYSVLDFLSYACTVHKKAKRATVHIVSSSEWTNGLKKNRFVVAISGLILRHVEYQVKSERLRSEVNRRYSDFQVQTVQCKCTLHEGRRPCLALATICLCPIVHIVVIFFFFKFRHHHPYRHQYHLKH